MENMIGGRPVVVKQLPETLSVEQSRSLFFEVEPSLKADRPRLVLDCSRVRELDSAGVQVLLLCLEEAMKRNGDVKLAAIPPVAAEILELTRVDGLFEAFESVRDAVNSFHQFPAYALEQVPEVALSTPAADAVYRNSKIAGSSAR
jgi:anti-sigma B factor antagonist